MLKPNLSKFSFSTLHLQRGHLQTQWWLTKMESAISFFTKDRIWCVVPGSLSWWGFFPLFYDLHLLRWYIQTGQAFSRPKATRFGGARPYRFSLLLFQKSHSASKGCPKIPILQFCWKLVQKLKLFLKVGRVQVAQVHWVQRAKGLRLPGFQDLIIRNKFWEEQGS